MKKNFITGERIGGIKPPTAKFIAENINSSLSERQVQLITEAIKTHTKQWLEYTSRVVEIEFDPEAYPLNTRTETIMRIKNKDIKVLIAEL